MGIALSSGAIISVGSGLSAEVNGKYDAIATRVDLCDNLGSYAVAGGTYLATPAGTPNCQSNYQWSFRSNTNSARVLIFSYSFVV